MTPFGSLHNVVNVLLGTPLSILGGSLGGSLIAETVKMLLWSCGLHGANIVGGVMSPIWYGAMDENRLAFQAGEALPNIFTTQFFEIWVNIGGSGATLALVITMFVRARSKQMKQLGRLAIGPAIFNINEPIIFGMPIVMNPMLLIPFIVVAAVNVNGNLYWNEYRSCRKAGWDCGAVDNAARLFRIFSNRRENFRSGHAVD